MRKPLSKKLRFEVFKRDSFTCQYCGRKAPEVILNVDHIHPVKEGGCNDIMNLITSCFDCNSGKKDRKLSDQSVLEKQKAQIEELNERRIQLEMMLEWRDEMEKMKDMKLDILVGKINSKLINRTLSEVGVKNIKKLLNKFGFEAIDKSIDIAEDKYLHDPSNIDQISLFLDKIPGIAFNLSKSPLDSKIGYAVNYICKVYGVEEKWKFTTILKAYCTALKDFWLYDDDAIIRDLEKEVLPLTNEFEKFYNLENRIKHWTNSIKEEK